MLNETLRGQTSHGGLYESAKSLVRNIIESLRTRLHLFSLELAEEKARVLSLAVFGAAAFICALVGLIFSGAFFIVWAWDTPYRLLIAGLVPLFFLLAAGVLLQVGRQRNKARGPMFAASLGEMVKDIDKLRGRSERATVPRAAGGVMKDQVR